jgi:asparagine synthase (glutamine-hydrolysing)
MLAPVMHRGPDGRRICVHGSIGFGQCDWSHSKQRKEILSIDGGAFTITADAHIDNRDSLSDELELRQDALEHALILAAYQRWSFDCVAHLEGEFAFAIYDSCRGTLFCARDHFGVRPFYYHYQPGRLFAFATEIKSLLSLPEVPRDLNHTRVADFMMDRIEDSASTIYAGVRRLLPAHTLTVTARNVISSRFWAPDRHHELQLGSDGEYVEAFRDRFEHAVACRMRSRKGVAAMLSGGIDSSSVAATMRHILGRDASAPLHVFSIEFPNRPQQDDRPYRDAFFEQGGSVSHPFHPAWDQLSDLDGLHGILDEPMNNPYLALYYRMLQSVRAEGFDTLLGGNGGDIVVSYNFAYLCQLARSFCWAELWLEATGIAQNYYYGRRSPWHVVRRHALRPLLPEGAYTIWRRWHGRPVREPGAELLIAPDFAREIHLQERLREAGARLPKTESFRERHCREVCDSLIGQGLEGVDKLAAACRIELRYPFWDRRLVELCVALPRRYLTERGWTRVILRRSLADLLPEATQRRHSKGDPNPAFASTLARSHQVWLDRVVADEDRVLEPYINLRALRELNVRYRGSGSIPDAYMLWLAGSLSSWLALRKRMAREEPVDVEQRTFE